MLLRVPYPPGQMKILMALEVVEGRVSKSYMKLKEETGLADPVLSDYLKRLRKKGLLMRDIDSREYYLSLKGKRKLKLLKLIQRLIEIIERQEVKPVEYVSEELIHAELNSEIRKQLDMLANCTSELQKTFLTLPRIQQLYGMNPYVTTEETANGIILLNLKRQKEWQQEAS